MAALLLTFANLQAVKTAAQRAWPDVKSSHITEALAAAYGYRTHAAALADLNRSAHPPLVRANPSAFSERLSDLGYPDRGSTPLVQALDEGIPDAIWSVCTSGDINAANRWYDQCRRRNIPRVLIQTRQKYCLLEWDSITMDDSVLHPKIRSPDTRDMFRRFQEKMQLGAGEGNPEFYGNGFVGSIDGLLLSPARELADDFFEMLYGPLRSANL
ncbi:MAG: hypothetical protein ACODTU_21890 [Pigmentiphaga sp.]|uniref:hypothetical protein n=1 Tax=Pigmentiphaga sp. TaxID=1977564 RepID=UPI003B536A83